MEPASFNKGKGTLRTIYKMITILLLKMTMLSGILQSEKRKGGLYRMMNNYIMDVDDLIFDGQEQGHSER